MRIYQNIQVIEVKQPYSDSASKNTVEMTFVDLCNLPTKLIIKNWQENTQLKFMLAMPRICSDRTQTKFDWLS